MLAIAGLWDEWTDKQSGEKLKSCTMIITEPNKFVEEVHDRMPVLLKPDQFDDWITGKLGKEALVPAPENALQKWRVSTRVNSSRTDDSDHTLIERLS
jgi:putative SOS response-associated peptidase YedK